MTPTFLLQLCLLITTALCASISGRFQTGHNLTVTDVQHTQFKVQQVAPVESSYKKSVFFQRDGSFVINGLVDGTFVLSIASIEYNLVPYKVRLDVAGEEVKAYAMAPGQLWEESTKNEISLPLVVFPNLKTPVREYIKQRSPGLLQSGPLATVINNPLYLAGALICLALAALPKVLEYMDPEGVANIRANAKEEVVAQREAKGANEAAKKLESITEKKKKQTSKSVKKRKN